MSTIRILRQYRIASFMMNELAVRYPLFGICNPELNKQGF